MNQTFHEPLSIINIYISSQQIQGLGFKVFFQSSHLCPFVCCKHESDKVLMQVNIQSALMSFVIVDTHTWGTHTTHTQTLFLFFNQQHPLPSDACPFENVRGWQFFKEKPSGRLLLREFAVAERKFLVATRNSFQTNALELSLIFSLAFLGICPSFCKVAENVFNPSDACSPDTVLA